MATNYPGLVTHLRKWGLNVKEVGGWQTRTASGSFTPIAVIAHHTATKGPANAPSLNIVTYGRTGIPGPLSQFVLARDGTVYVVSGGRANHAGTGGPKAGIPKDSGNRYAWGIEAENDGVGEAWPAAQLNAYYKLTAALLALMGKGASSVIGHKEWAPTRKIDPKGIDMNTFRANVDRVLKAGPGGAVAQGDPVIGEGDRGQYVINIQNALVKHGFKVTVDGDFGPGTKAAVVAFQKAKGLVADGIVGQKTWDALRKAPADAPAPAPAPAPTPAPTPTGNLVIGGNTRMLVQFKGDPHVWEVVGSTLVHVTATAWKARGLTSAQVKVIEPTHPLSALPKKTT